MRPINKSWTQYSGTFKNIKDHCLIKSIRSDGELVTTHTRFRKNVKKEGRQTFRAISKEYTRKDGTKDIGFDSITQVKYLSFN